MTNKITVFEQSKLHVDGDIFKQHHFDALVKYNDLHKSKYFITGHNKISFKSYVGVIQVNNIVIEILPKADSFSETDEATKRKWQSALLYMLQQAGYIKLNVAEKALQQSYKGDLLDIYLYAFLNEVECLIHAGLIKKYHRVRQNQTALKGKLLIEKQIQCNIIHKENFFNEHNIYDKNNDFNSILKKALEITHLVTNNYCIRQNAAKSLLNFETIDSWQGKAKDFNKLIFDRKTKSYSYAIELARMIILNYCPEISAGRKPVLAILFDMNRLFEKFIYSMLKKEEKNFKENKLRIQQQNSRLFWKRKTIRPDIIIDFERKEDNKVIFSRIIVDTKWKIIYNDNPSADDLKQMYAYNFQFGSNRSILFFPSVGQKNLGKAMYKESFVRPYFGHSCELWFADLFDKDLQIISRSFSKKFLNYLFNDG